MLNASDPIDDADVIGDLIRSSKKVETVFAKSCCVHVLETSFSIKCSTKYHSHFVLRIEIFHIFFHITILVAEVNCLSAM